MKYFKSLLLAVLYTLALFTVTAQNSKNTSNPVKTGTSVGNKAPEIALPDPSGKILKLSSLKGYIVLVDFWASWCHPCREENPNVVKAYKIYTNRKFKDAKGFLIFSVSLDTDKKLWINAIKDDNLSWKYHVSELNGWKSSVVSKYKVRSIPSNFLLDKNGIIIGKDIRGENLHMELEKNVRY